MAAITVYIFRCSICFFQRNWIYPFGHHHFTNKKWNKARLYKTLEGHDCNRCIPEENLGNRVFRGREILTIKQDFYHTFSKTGGEKSANAAPQGLHWFIHQFCPQLLILKSLFVPHNKYFRLFNNYFNPHQSTSYMSKKKPNIQALQFRRQFTKEGEPIWYVRVWLSHLCY